MSLLLSGSNPLRRGGSRWRALWGVLVPISLPGMVSVGMYTFMQAWNEYLFALALTQTTEMEADDPDCPLRIYFNIHPQLVGPNGGWLLCQKGIPLLCP